MTPVLVLLAAVASVMAQMWRRTRPSLQGGSLARPMGWAAGWPGWCLALVAVPVWAGSAGAAEDWPQFRGPSGNGAVAAGHIPTEWSEEKHLAWKTRLPGSGWSQPVIVGDLIFLTAAVSEPAWRPKDYASGLSDSHTVSGGRVPAPAMELAWQVLAFDLPRGALKWARTAASGRPKYAIHPSNTYASETPAADANGVYAWFGAAGTLAALDHAGRLLWRRELGVFRQQDNLGTSSSVRLHDGLLYLQCFNEEQAFAVCLEARDGREKWRTTRSAPGTAWGTPLLWPNQRRLELLFAGQKLLTSHDPVSGRELWRAGGLDMPGPSSLAADARRIYFGFRSPFKTASLYALEAGAEGDQSGAEGTEPLQCAKWATPGAAAGLPSPVAADGCVYVLHEAILTCLDAATGKLHYKERLPGFRGAVASPITVGHNLLALDESGHAVVLRVGPAFKLLGQSHLADTFWASPAAARGWLALRGVEHLYGIREGAPAGQSN